MHDRKPTHYNRSSSTSGMLMPRPSTAWSTRQHGQQGRRAPAIVNTNLKTELCRNYEKGVCTYGDRCAFAHGREELKYRTLREMQNAGRIPDAVKYRCIPCMTWVATGSCPYSTRCVFIHDPRAQGRQEAWLYAGSHMSSAYHSSDSAFFFPDLPRDPDSMLPRDSSVYDLDPAMCNAEDRADRAVYNMWYSFVSVLTNIEANKTHTPPPSSSNSTMSLSGRSYSFGSNSSASPTHSSSSESISSMNSGGGGGGGSHFSRTTASSSARGFGLDIAGETGGENEGRNSLASDQHLAAERRLRCGGCPRLQAFISLSRGVPAGPRTADSPTFSVEGFPYKQTKASHASSHFAAAMRGGPPDPCSRASPPAPQLGSPALSLRAVNQPYAAQPRAGNRPYPRSLDVSPDCGCSRSSAAAMSASPPPPPLPRCVVMNGGSFSGDGGGYGGGVCAHELSGVMTGGSNLPPTNGETSGRRHYSHQRHSSTTARRNNADMETLSRAEGPRSGPRHSLSASSFPEVVKHPVPQPFRLEPAFPEPRTGSQRFQGERVRRWTLDQSRKGNPVSQRDFAPLPGPADDRRGILGYGFTQ
ncbi:unnamed protein product [Scytosiphon promiscuus]